MKHVTDRDRNKRIYVCLNTFNSTVDIIITIHSVMVLSVQYEMLSATLFDSDFEGKQLSFIITRIDLPSKQKYKYDIKQCNYL